MSRTGIACGQGEFASQLMWQVTPLSVRGAALRQGRGESVAEGSDGVCVCRPAGFERHGQPVPGLVGVPRDEVQVEVEHGLPGSRAGAVELLARLSPIWPRDRHTTCDLAISLIR